MSNPGLRASAVYCAKYYLCKCLAAEGWAQGQADRNIVILENRWNRSWLCVKNMLFQNVASSFTYTKVVLITNLFFSLFAPTTLEIIEDQNIFRFVQNFVSQIGQEN